MNNSALSEMQDLITSDIINQFTTMMEQPEIRYDVIKSEYEKFALLVDIGKVENATRREMLIGALSKHPLNIVNHIIPYIKGKSYHIEAKLNIDSEDYREKSEFMFTECIDIDDFSVVTDLDYPSISVFHDDGTDVTNNIKIDIENDRVNYLSGEIYLKGKIALTADIDDFILFDDYLNKYIDITAFGLMKNDDIPSWVEYLIEGCINLEYKNKKMAVFNIFAAFDNFIELINRKIFDYYVENYSYHIDLFRRDILNGIDGELKEAEDYLKEKIKLFGRDTRRIDEKLKDALREVGIKGDNPNFKKMFELIKEISKIEKMRNTIGHGSKVESEIDVGKSLYCVLTMILSILYFEDMESNGWSNIILA